MTQLLQKALAELKKLPNEQQDDMAAFILAELESERKWDIAFENSQDTLAQLAEEALKEHRTD